MLEEPPSIVIGAEGADHLALTVMTAPSVTRADDWLRAKIRVRAGGFAASYEAALLLGDFERLRDDLSRVNESLVGTAEFRPLEEQLTFDIVGDGRGHLVVRGIACDQFGGTNRLYFEIAFDQTYLPRLLTQLARLVAQVRGGEQAQRRTRL